ncbi:MAG: 16S rRNA (guanine(527)-N(7))-methyltransferase RsmG [Brachymonas sp.]|nr:16S rRNA (guanine(527)-N(7))-methyltransferase RsmG [Brachymonas sp.]
MTELANAMQQKLQNGLQALDLSLSVEQQAQLLRYMELLAQWNKVYNLTALRDPADMLTHHVLDSLAVITPLHRHTQGKAMKLLDVGSGGGLPGVVIAICCPEIQVTCVDAVAKKTAFIQQVAGALKLNNLQAQHIRVENIHTPYDLVVSRAFASLPDFTDWSASALAENGVWLAMKGKQPLDEMAALPASVEVFHVEPLQVPGLDAERCLIWMRKRASSFIETVQNGIS